MPADDAFRPGRQILPVAAARPAQAALRFKDLPLARGLRGGWATGVCLMATPNIQTHANPAAVHAAVLPASVTQPAQPSFAARRSFKSFVEAMDDFGGDRRDVAGMRQMLAMQAENQRLAAARAAAPAVSSFAPDRTEPEVPVVRGPARDSALPRPSPASVLPSLPAATTPSRRSCAARSSTRCARSRAAGRARA
jgi:hypothetical protein